MGDPSGLPRLTRRSDGKAFRIIAQEPSPDGVTVLYHEDGRAFERVETSNNLLARDFTDEQITGPGIGDLARIAFEAYGASTGGKTWDGKPLPSFDEIRRGAPRVAKAWENAVGAVLAALENSR